MAPVWYLAALARVSPLDALYQVELAKAWGANVVLWLPRACFPTWPLGSLSLVVVVVPVLYLAAFARVPFLDALYQEGLAKAWGAVRGDFLLEA